jgi:hypothetical protein
MRKCQATTPATSVSWNRSCRKDRRSGTVRLGYIGAWTGRGKLLEVFANAHGDQLGFACFGKGQLAIQVGAEAGDGENRRPIASASPVPVYSRERAQRLPSTVTNLIRSPAASLRSTVGRLTTISGGRRDSTKSLHSQLSTHHERGRGSTRPGQPLQRCDFMAE